MREKVNRSGTRDERSVAPLSRFSVRYWSERLIEGGMATSALLTVIVTLLIVLVLGRETWRFFRDEEVTIWQFLTGTRWAPLAGGTRYFGIWPLVCGTFVVTVVAMAIALPLGMVTAIYLSEYAPQKLRALLKPTLELLAGIPTVVYGFFALTAITPFLKLFVPGLGVYNALSAGIAVGILCLPTVTSLSEDALRAVPNSLREAAYGLGGTRFDVSVKVVVPAAVSGIVSAFLLAMARAVGETMIVALAAGSMPQLSLDPRQEMQTMTGFMVQMALGDVNNFGVEYLSMYAVAAALFLLTLSLTLCGGWVRRRYREEYQ
ncbi:MAG: phosphate transport system permease protein [Pirellulaceae bacterium]|nr:MAG: phosphate transport system permease protein [Pirellulaceae bacterium]